MKNSFLDKIYHYYVSKRYGMKTFRGSWMLTRRYINDYKSSKWGEIFKVHSVHKLGFVYEDYKILDSRYEKRKYLNNRDYYSLHPLNGNESFWIDDKLTLKYILNGTYLGKYLPKYYFQINDSTQILPLTDVDANVEKASVEDVISMLEKKRELAFKKIKASLGEGFIKAEYRGNDNYQFNGRKCNRVIAIEQLSQMRDYLVMELLRPHPMIKQFSDKSVGSLRFQIGRKLSGEIINMFSYLRVGTEVSDSVENYAAGGVLTFVNMTDGSFEGGHILDKSTLKDIIISDHPDTNANIKGSIPFWDEIKTVARNIAKMLPQMNYMGIDFCVTDKDEVKILEINSLTSLDAIQLEQSIYDMPCGEFFRERLTKK